MLLFLAKKAVHRPKLSIKKEIVRSSIAGTLVGATDYGSYYLLFHFLPFSLAKGISCLLAGIIAYWFNKYWVFQYSTLTSRSEIGRYVLINFLGLGVNVLTNQLVLNMRSGAILPALISASAVTGLVTFICFKLWVFKVSQEK